MALVSAAAPPVLTGSLGGRQVFPPTNWWNLDISKAPLDPASAAFINFVSGRTPSNPTATARVHDDFGPSPYGIPYVVVSGDQPLVRPTWTNYGDESDEGAPGRPLGYPIPDEAKTQPNYIEGGVAGGGTSGDRHMLIVDKDNWLLYETAVTRWHAASNSWRADCGAIFNLRRSDRRPDTWTSADAAGLAIFPGSCATRKCTAPRRSCTPSGSPCERPTATSGPRPIVPDRPAARSRWGRACG